VLVVGRVGIVGVDFSRHNGFGFGCFEVSL
jgi:hypothetical protein